MKFAILSIGKLKEACESKAVETYLKRAASGLRSIGVSRVENREFAESRAANATRRMLEEARTLRKAAGKRAVIIALDQRGENLTSKNFAGKLQKMANQGSREIVFLIGGPDGLDAKLRDEAALVISFGAMTWPHRMVRMMLAEQIYRASSIFSGHPYHR